MEVDPRGWNYTDLGSVEGFSAAALHLMTDNLALLPGNLTITIAS